MGRKCLFPVADLGWFGLPGTRTVTSWSEAGEATVVAGVGAQAIQEAKRYISSAWGRGTIQKTSTPCSAFGTGGGVQPVTA